jgi:signal transduction histidine kinase
VRLANGMEPWKRGENVLEVRDIDGKPYVRFIVARAREKGFGWVQYKWKNPASQKVELKLTYYEVIQGAVISCGIYLGERGVSMRKLDQQTDTSQAAPTQQLRQAKNPRVPLAIRR